MSEPFPWRRLMELGLGTLRLSPKDFWAATPRELAAALGRPGSMTRNEFNQLTDQYPDLP